MKKEDINVAVFKSVNEIMFSDGQRLAVVYYPISHTTETVGISISRDARICVDHLPRTGYSNSMFDPCDYGEKIIVFRNGIYTFEEAMFLDEDEFYDVVFLENGDAYKARVTLVPNGVGRWFKLYFKDETTEEDYFSREAYGVKFVVAKK